MSSTTPGTTQMHPRVELLLGKDRVFAIERVSNKVRLIALDDVKELACRKTLNKPLLSFLHEGNGSMFKGRLRLLKSGSAITVSVSGDTIGVIDANDFSTAIKGIL